MGPKVKKSGGLKNFRPKKAGGVEGLIVPIWPPVLEDAQAGHSSAVLDALSRLKVDVSAQPPDLVLTISPFWVGENCFFVESSPRHRARTDYHGYNADLAYVCPGAPEFAAELIARGQAAGIPVKNHSHWPDVASTVPLRLLFPAQQTPLIPLSGSELSLDTALAWGRVIRDAALASGKRVLFLSGGGLSHNLTACLHWEESIAAVIFDQKGLNCLTAGRGTDGRQLDPFWIKSGTPPAGFSDLFLFLCACGEERCWDLRAYVRYPGVGWARRT